jgi:dihydrodiol dehydrogenase / D-xylose 1-dehydrogenase (NADP)
MAKTVRWGILGAGKIARKFAAGVQSAAGAELAAVGSRSEAKAHAFGDEFDIPHRCGSYEDLAQSSEVDAVYVATPHPMHKDPSILCLNAGKAVLCEKPFTVNAAEAEEVIAAARANDVFCMEAMWSRFLPPIVRLREMLAAGAIGDVRMVMADFGFRCGWNPNSRLLDPHLAGGGLLDVGIYPLSLAAMILGEARQVSGLAHLGETGVDEQAGMVLSYDGGRLALLATGVRTTTPMEAWVLGTEGKIHLHHAWWHGSRMTLTAQGKDPEDIDVPVEGNGYNYQVEEVGRCLAAGKTESDIMPLAETLSVLRTMDRLRALWGLKYPME